MPFGSFDVKVRAANPAAKKEDKTRSRSAAPRSSGIVQKSGNRLNILLIGRNLSVMQEFLCSMNQNINEALHEYGLSYYTRELETISDIVEKKKKLEQFFWKFSTDDWNYREEEPDEKRYTFSISPAGNPSNVLDLAIHCVKPGTENDEEWRTADAVWLMTDGLFLCGNAAKDSYTGYLRDALHLALEQEPEGTRPVCLILSQIEQLGRFNGEIPELPRKAMQELASQCRDYFSGAAGTNGRAALIPVQVYGGMECIGADDAGNPVLHIGESGFYQTYMPCNCQSPLFYTIKAVSNVRQSDFFIDMVGGGLAEAARHYYGMKYEEWKPEITGGKENV